MFKIKYLGAAAVPVLAVLALAVPAASAGTAPLNVALSASGTGASAAWVGNSIVLTPGAPPSTTYAQMAVVSPPSAPPAAPPSFTTDNYAAGSPRWVIEFSNSCYLFGYPAQLPGTGVNASFTGPQWQVNGHCTSSHGVYETYSQALGDIGTGAAVTSAYIVADGDQAAGTHDTLTAVQYNGQSPLAPSVLTARYVCGPWNHRHWSVANTAGGRARTGYVRVWETVKGHSFWGSAGTVHLNAGQSRAVWTKRGGRLRVGYWRGAGSFTYAYATAGNIACP